ncbi:beta-N-acetylglucosaminidase domain-containing protein [[Mycoplasma] testudinis]|uniref:beta-N-acetylglucosaminidase domain-containing protein n=1 Tax=[Mycoplasma] testudinis TaxID=33924 RepID=UPI0004811004|nr:beta-N-acetylglucosaminidase domain-containing protein [[Mycoplasma] testudinis]
MKKRRNQLIFWSTLGSVIPIIGGIAASCANQQNQHKDKDTDKIPIKQTTQNFPEVVTAENSNLTTSDFANSINHLSINNTQEAFLNLIKASDRDLISKNLNNKAYISSVKTIANKNAIKDKVSVQLTIKNGNDSLTRVVKVSGLKTSVITQMKDIYPSPQNVKLLGGSFQFLDKTEVIYDSGIDIYTKDKLQTVLDKNNIDTLPNVVLTSAAQKYTPDSKNTHIYVGIAGSSGFVDNYVKSQSKLINLDLFTKDTNYDAYQLYVKDHDIFILGKTQDAAFYGVVTLEHLLDSTQETNILNVAIEDYANVQYRGFIEGYYGNPWSFADREELMKFGGTVKSNMYIYGPKNDPYHNSKWRELYPPAELEKIKHAAQVGNESKTRFVWTVHAFMNQRFRFDNNYENDLNVMEAKFSQVITAGVRQIGLLADDASGASNANMIRLLTDLTNFLIEKQKAIPDLKTDLFYVPAAYYGSNPGTDLKALPKSVQIVQTGGKIWGEVTSDFGQQFKNAMGRPPFYWVNWPVTDNSKNHLIMGGQDIFLHPGVDPSTVAGIVLNPMQQSEPSKVAIFLGSDYAWNIWKDKQTSDKAWENAFSYVDHLNSQSTAASDALRELSKHMQNQNMDWRVRSIPESVELAKILDPFVNNGLNNYKDENKQKIILDLITEFEKINNAAITYKTQGYERLRNQIIYWLNAAQNISDANINFLNAFIALKNNDLAKAWTDYSNGVNLYNKSRSYGFDYVGGTQYAEFGVQHIVPAAKKLMSRLASELQTLIRPNPTEAKPVNTDTVLKGSIFKTSGYNVASRFGSSENNLTDGNDSTNVWYETPGDQTKAGDFIGFNYGKPYYIGRVHIVVGGTDNADKWHQYDLQYSLDNQTWKTYATYSDNNPNGNSTYTIETDFSTQGIQAQYIRLVNKTNVPKWARFSEFKVSERTSQFTFTNNSTYANIQNQLTDGAYALLPTNNITLDKDQYIGIKLNRLQMIKGLEIQTSNNLANLSIESSIDGLNWTSVASQTPDKSYDARYVRLINKTDSVVKFDLNQFKVNLDILKGITFKDTNMNNVSQGEDARTIHTTGNWFDQNRGSRAKFADTQKKGQYVEYDLGQTRMIKKLTLVNSEGSLDYLRNGTVDISPDGKTWTPIIKVGDNKPGAPQVDDLNGAAGYTRDPAGGYVIASGELIDKVAARYIRVNVTQDYPYRWLEINEIEINDNEYVSTSNDPTFSSNVVEIKDHGPQNLTDNNFLSYYQPNMKDAQNGELTYTLSDNLKLKYLTFLQGGNKMSNATVEVRTNPVTASTPTWVALGKLDNSLNKFTNLPDTNIYQIRISWGSVTPVLYEMLLGH